MPQPPPATSSSPRPAYEERLARWGGVHRRAKRVHDLLAWARLGALIALVVTAYERCGARGGSTVAVLTALVLVVALSVAVGKAAAAIARATEAERYYQAGLARLAGSWEAVVSEGRAYEPAEHPYAADLDLFGPQSLFALLCTARTSTGQRRLAAWLCAGARADEVRARQAAVAELRDRPDLREEIWRAAGTLSQEVQPEVLESWLEGPARPVTRGAPAAGAVAGVSSRWRPSCPSLVAGQPLWFLGMLSWSR